MVMGIVSVLPLTDGLHRLGIDGLLVIRHWVSGPIYPKDASEVAVVVIDEQTYQTSPFDQTPKIAWTPYMAQIINAIHAANPKVMGLDIVLPTSIDRPELLKGYDKPLLKSFLKAGRAGKLVLGEVSLTKSIITPYEGQVMVIGGQKNIRPLNILIDDDGIARRYPHSFPKEDGSSTPSFGVELAKRAGFDSPGHDFLINYNTGADSFPTYSFADLLKCSESGDTEFYQRYFKDKIVLIGTALDIEDRRLPAKRFVTGLPDASRHPRCVLAANTDEFGATIQRQSIPGIFIHAAAINTIAKNNKLTIMTPWERFAFVAFGVILLSIPFFRFPPITGLVSGTILLTIGMAISFIFFLNNLVAPIVIILAAAIITPGVIYGFRFIIEDQQKRWISNAFAHYLAPVMVDKLANDPSLLELGGKVERITIFFSDIAGFTTLSEQLKEHPDQLVHILNLYLTVVTDVIEEHGGYVDKFIGDAVMAVWGAPLADPNAEENAVNAAIAIQKALDKFNADMLISHPNTPPIKTRIGLNTGEALVGNMGSNTRLNYTVAGDPVNLAARLEGANKMYGSAIMIGEDTATMLGDGYLLRFLDNIAVKGKDLPVKVYEPVASPTSPVDDETKRSVVAFNEAMKLYQGQKFLQAQNAFKQLEPLEVASLYEERCEIFIKNPPPADWDGSFKMTTK